MCNINYALFSYYIDMGILKNKRLEIRDKLKFDLTLFIFSGTSTIIVLMLLWPKHQAESALWAR